MNDDDDPVALLNLTEETASEPGRGGGWWLASILVLVLCSGLGVLVALSLPRHESDWIGARFILAIVGGIVAGAILSVACAAVSFARHEQRRVWCLPTALPALLILLGCVGTLLQEVVGRYQAKAADAARLEARAAIEADPEIVLREHWDRPGNEYHYAAYRNSFGDPQVHYTASQLQRIYDEAPAMRDNVFQHPACPPEFITARFEEAWPRRSNISYVMLANIAANPNTPLVVIEKIAQTPGLPVGATQPAKDALKKRKAAAAAHP